MDLIETFAIWFSYILVEKLAFYLLKYQVSVRVFPKIVFSEPRRVDDILSVSSPLINKSDLPDNMYNAPSGLLPFKYFRNFHLSVGNVSCEIKNRIQNLTTAQSLGGVNKSSYNYWSCVKIITAFTWESCQLKKLVVQQSAIIYSNLQILKFFQKNLKLWCIFYKFTDNANNFKKHVNSNKHNKKDKVYMASKWVFSTSQSNFLLVVKQSLRTESLLL